MRDVAFVSTGAQTSRVLAAADLLAGAGIQASVVHVPCDQAARRRGAGGAVGDVPVWSATVEEHTVHGGLGGLVAETASPRAGAAPRIERIGLDDTWGESAGNDFMLEKHGLSAARIADRVAGLVPARAAG